MEAVQFGENLFRVFIRGPTGANEIPFKECEQKYNALKNDKQNFISLHILVLQKSQDVSVRKFAVNQFSTEIMKGKTSVYVTLDDGFRNTLNQTLIGLMNSENDFGVLNGYANIIGRAYTSMQALKKPWNDVHRAIFEWIMNGDSNHRIRAFQILTEDILYSQSKEEYIQLIQQYVQIIQYGLQKHDISWTKDTFKLFQVLTQTSDVEADVNNLYKIYPTFVEYIQEAINTKVSDDIVSDLLRSIDELFEEENEYAIQYIPITVQLCSGVCLQLSNDEDVQLTAFDALLTMCERFTPVFKQNKTMLYVIYEVIVLWVSTIKVTQEWLQDNDNDEDLILYSRGVEGLSSMVSFFGSAQTMNFIFQHYSLANGNCEQRHVFLQFVYRSFEGSKKPILKQSMNIFNIIFPFYLDESPRNRILAVIIINKLFTIDQKNRSNFLSPCIQIIAKLLADPVPRIVSRVCDFVSCLLDNIDSNLMKPYFGDLLKWLLSLLNSNQKKVISEALCAISFIALKMKFNFVHYYPEVLQVLKTLLNNIGTNQEYYEIKGRLIECLSVIALELKGDYCSECGNIILQEVDKVLKLPNIKIEDSLFGFVETSFTRLAEILQERFAPFLPTVLQIVLSRAQMNVICGQDDKRTDDTKNVYVDHKPFSIHTGLTDEKRNAVNSICDFASDLKSIFYPFAQPCLEVVLKLVQDPFDEDLRALAAKCVFKLLKVLESGKMKEIKNEIQVKQENLPTVLTCINVILDQLNKERFVDTITKILNYLDCIIDFCPENSIPEQTMDNIVQMINTLFNDGCNRIVDDEKQYEELEAKLQREPNEEDGTELEEGIKEQKRVESNFRMQLRIFISTLCKTQPRLSVSLINKYITPQICAILNKQNIIPLEMSFCDIILCTVSTAANQPEMIKQLSAIFLDRISKGICVENTLLYLAKLIEYPSTKEFIPRIVQIVQQTFQLREQNKRLYEIGILCFGKCIIQEPSLFDQAVVSNWLNVLPLTRFDDEIIFIMFTLIAKKVIIINTHTMKRVLDILIRTISDGCIDNISSTTKEIVSFYIRQWATTTTDIFNQLISSYNPEEQEILKELCNPTNT
ncbi:importin beta-3, putative [Entamoeba histolytica HM-3:IMSS]|uniref:Importin beta-3, putative n=1 Tax=Entamoeba histolytica HM-3:IMSS TaxID=885315 RepID=M7WJX9_ENTHI|nr:importin beta-3, putative [Entamoeba histolytica HM-3:IMSS]